MYDKDYIKNNLTIDNIYAILEEFGANPSMNGQVIVSETICHSLPGEGSHKLYYYDNTKLFRCYTDCSEYFDIFELVLKVYNLQFLEDIALGYSIALVGSKFGFTPSLEEDGFKKKELDDWLIIGSYDKLSIKKTDPKQLKVYDDSILTKLPFLKILPWIKEGISVDTMKRYGIKYYAKDCQIIIPHYNDRGELIGIRGRALVKEDADKYGKYRPAIINRNMYNHPLGFALYGLDKTKNAIAQAKTAIVFEGEKSVMLYDSLFGSENNISVASCGSGITIHQFELLEKLGIQELVIAFDRQFEEIGDKDFKNHVKNLNKIAAKFKNSVRVSCIFDKKKITDFKSSPIDHGKEIFLKLFKERIIL